MRHESVMNLSGSGIDWKGFGYLVSIVSVFLLGALAWPKAGDPRWHLPALIAGMAASVLGMGIRYLAHRREQKEILRKSSAQKR